MKKKIIKDIKELVDITKVTRNQMYDYLHERVMWLIEDSLNKNDNE